MQLMTKHIISLHRTVLHLDASNIDGLNNTTLNDDDYVSQWTDLSGNDTMQLKVVEIDQNITRMS